MNNFIIYKNQNGHKILICNPGEACFNNFCSSKW